MSDAGEEAPASSPPPAARAPVTSPPPGDAKIPEFRPNKEKEPHFSAGKPSKHSKEKLMAAEGIIPSQSGTNKYASQRGQTGFGVPRDVVDHVKCQNLKPIEDEAKISKLRESLRLQTGTNKFASQKGMTGFGCPRDVLSKPKGTGGASEVPEEKARATDGIIVLQSGTNKLASQAGMTGFGMPRLVYTKKQPEQDKQSEGFINLQMGTNRFATQAGMTGIGMPRHNITKYKDEARGEIPNDETALSRQTSGWKEGASQNGMTGFGAFRNTTSKNLKDQERNSQGLVPYQMGINWGDSMAGKTAYGMPRQTFTAYSDDSDRMELPESLARAPEVPFWSGMERDFATQSGMTAIGMPRDVNGKYLRRMW